MRIEYVTDEWENLTDSMSISEDEAQIFFNVKQDEIFEHLKKSIGIATPTDTTRIVPRYNVGDLSLSIQFAYYLWKYRCNNEDSSNSPITEEEFYDIIGDDANNTNLLDVMVEFKGVRIIQPQQMKLHHLVVDLYRMVKL